MRISALTVTGSFKYLWLKHVTGVDLSKHCARCLRGTYSEDVGPHVAELSDLHLADGVWYLCGVSQPYRWSLNFHLAFHDCPGSTVEVCRNGVSIVIEDAEALPISPSNIDPTDPNVDRREFFTCRNWQFAHWLSGAGRSLLPR